MTVDVVLLFGRLALLALLYLFLFAVVRAGIRVVSGGPTASGAVFAGAGTPWSLLIEKGPAELRGVRVPLDGAVTIGRGTGADIAIADTFVSTRHARVSPGAVGPVVEDLDSTNGTVLNGNLISRATTLKAGDRLTLGDVVLKVEKR
jgi:pSer/pThr/pTyr-binding forkhead associated (FHA) protein